MKKRLLSVLLSLAMIVGLIPTTVLAAEQEINYVSLGDSMTNGYGLPGYDGNTGCYDYGEESYANKFAAWLIEADYAADVNHSQLAMSAMRSEDLHWLLELDYEDAGAIAITDGAWDEAAWNAKFTTGDYWTWNEMCDDYRFAVAASTIVNGNPNAKITTGEAAIVAKTYQDAVKNADIISLGMGNGNFGVFMFGRIMEAIGFGGGEPADAMIYNVERAIAECDPEIQDSILALKDELYAVVEGRIGMPIAENPTLEALANTVVYTSLSYVLNYAGSVEAILQLNPDAEIILVALMNTFADEAGSAEGISIGDLLDAVFTPLNAYIAALPTVMQATGNSVYADATFYYAEAADVECLVEVYETELRNPESAIRSRFVESIVGTSENPGMVWGLLAPMVGGIVEGAELKAITLDDVVAYENLSVAEKIGYAAADQNKAISCALYLAFEDAVVASTQNGAAVSLDSILGLGAMDASLFAGVMEIFGQEITGDSEAYFETVVGILAAANGLTPDMIKAWISDPGSISTAEAGELVSAVPTLCMLLALPETLSAAIQADPAVSGLLALFGRCVIGNGLGGHPSDAGHAALFEAVRDAYDNGYTAKDETISNVTAVLDAAAALIAEYYDEAYAYGYQYAADNGYIDAANAAIDKAIAELNAIKLNAYQMTDELKAEVQAAIDEMIETLEAAKDLLTEAGALGQDALNALLALPAKAADVAAALKDALIRAGIDVVELTVIPYITDELIPAVQKAAGEMAAKAGEYLKEKLGDAYDALIEAVDAALTGADQALYDWLYNNPEQVIAFFAEYGDEIAALTEKYGEQALGVLAYVAYTYGDEMVDYIINNPEEVLNTLVGWYGEYGYRVWPMIDKYLEALGVYDEIEKIENETRAQIEAALEQIKAALEEVKKTIDEDIAPAVRAEIEALIAQVEAQIAYLEAVVRGEIEATAQEVIKALEQMNETVKNIIAAAKAEGEAFLEAAAAELKRAICEAINALQTQVEKQLGIVDAAIKAKVNEVLEQAKAALENIKNAIDEDIAPAIRAEIEALIAQVEAQIAYLEAVVNGQIEASVQDIIAALKQMNETVEDLFAAVKAEGEALAQAAVAELQRVIDEAIDAFLIKAYYATNLTITKCAYPELTYLALGGATAAEGTYAEIIAEYLEAANAVNAADAALTYADLLTYITENAAAIAGADVITYQMDANEIVEALVNVMLATATGGEYTSPEWSNYVDVEGINEAQATAQALQAKVAQYLRAEDLEALESIENQVMARIDAAIDEETMEQIRPYAECLVYGLVSYAVENAKAIEAIKTINPDAEIVMLGLYNTLNGVTVVVNGETIDLGELFDYVVEAVDVYNLVYAVVSENVTIVNISGAAVDGAELNVDEIVGLYAKLQGGGLTLDEMLAAGEAIEVALANVEAAVYGTANAEGQAYIAEQIKAAVTVMDHDYIAVVTEPTCTEAGYTTYTCSVCGDDYVVDGEGATGHVYDNDSDAFCNVCGDEREIGTGDAPIIPDPVDPTPVVPSQPTLSKDCDKGANCPLNAFPDLSVNEWYHNGIHYCVENKLMQGYLDGTFGANININRGQIVTILWRQAGSPAPKSECTFKDVPKGMYCYDAVAWANENGIALGYEDGTFRPTQAILRQQLVTFFYRYAKWSGADMTAENTVISAYSDAATVSAYAVPAMKWAIGTGVIQGYTDSTIKPHGNASRAHAAAVIQRFCEKGLK